MEARLGLRQFACIQWFSGQCPTTLELMTPNWYERHILPAALDFACGMPMISHMRQLVVPLAQGRVLEVGIGTGLNMRH